MNTFRQSSIALLAAAFALSSSARAFAEFSPEQVAGRRVAVHSFGAATAELADTHVRTVLAEAPKLAGIAHVFVREGADEKWEASFAAPAGLVYFATPEEAAAFKVTADKPELIVLDEKGRELSRTASDAPTDIAPLAKWPSLATHDVHTETTYNVQGSLPAVEGYDVVSYRDGEPVKGEAAISSQYEAITYLFATEEHRTAFAIDPKKYAPAYGGWCAWAMADGDRVEVDPKSYKIVDGQLLLYYNGLWGNTLKKWNNGAEAELKGKADANWAKMAAKR